MARRGYTLVSGNNRGHDIGATLRRGAEASILGGGAWEKFDESPHDVAAWVDFVAALGYMGVVLLGHSLGALKVAYYQAQRQVRRVVALIAASPPLRAGQVDPDRVALAKTWVAEGRGEDLLPRHPDRPVEFQQSAQTLLSWARANIDTYGWRTPDPAIGNVRCPVLALLGTNEEWVGTAADLEIIRRNARQASRVDTLIVQGADHVYAGQEDEVAGLIAGWLGDVLR